MWRTPTQPNLQTAHAHVVLGIALGDQGMRDVFIHPTYAMHVGRRALRASSEQRLLKAAANVADVAASSEPLAAAIAMGDADALAVALSRAASEGTADERVSSSTSMNSRVI